MSRPIALLTLVVATVLAVATPLGAAGADAHVTVPTADEPTWATGAALVLGLITVVSAIVIYGLGSRRKRS